MSLHDGHAPPQINIVDNSRRPLDPIAEVNNASPIRYVALVIYKVKSNHGARPWGQAAEILTADIPLGKVDVPMLPLIAVTIDPSGFFLVY